MCVYTHSGYIRYYQRYFLLGEDPRRALQRRKEQSFPMLFDENVVRLSVD